MPLDKTQTFTAKKCSLNFAHALKIIVEMKREVKGSGVKKRKGILLTIRNSIVYFCASTVKSATEIPAPYSFKDKSHLVIIR